MNTLRGTTVGVSARGLQKPVCSVTRRSRSWRFRGFGLIGEFLAIRKMGTPRWHRVRAGRRSHWSAECDGAPAQPARAAISVSAVTAPKRENSGDLGHRATVSNARTAMRAPCGGRWRERNDMTLIEAVPPPLDRRPAGGHAHLRQLRCTGKSARAATWCESLAARSRRAIRKFTQRPFQGPLPGNRQG